MTACSSSSSSSCSGIKSGGVEVTSTNHCGRTRPHVRLAARPRRIAHRQHQRTQP
jgi:hypothetical protein